MRPHRHDLLPLTDLHPTHPVPDVSVERQAQEMRRLRDAHNHIATGYRERDGIMVALSLSNSLSRHDMAVATGLAKSRVDQIIRDTRTKELADTTRELVERTARHMPAQWGVTHRYPR